MSVLLGISVVLMVMAAIGLLGNTAQLSLAWWFFRVRPPRAGHPPIRITILKPLCGADDDLEANLRQFATLPYPNYELLLGVKDTSDPAYPLAAEAARRWPWRVRLLLQQGEPGLNPKVNQLCTLEQAATGQVLLVSDSNCRAPDGYLEEIASIFESDPSVACTSNPIVGVGEEKLGSTLDNLHLATSAAPGVVSAKAVGKDLVVGKSMALRRADLERMGGFHSARNHLAEDYVLGTRVAELGKKVRVCRLPVYQVSQKRTFRDFLGRHCRWATIQRTAVAPWTYLGYGLMNPVPFTVLALLLYPSRATLLCFAAAWAARVAIDTAAIRLHRPLFGPLTPLYVLLKDLSIFSAWCRGAFSRTVVWRGHRLRVDHGSLLQPGGAHEPGPARAPELAPAPSTWPPVEQDGERTAA